MKQKFYNELFENCLEKMFHLILCVKFAMTVYVCVHVCERVCLFAFLCSMCSWVFILCIWLFLYCCCCCCCKFCWENWNAQTIAPAMQLTHLVNVRYLYALQHALQECVSELTWVYWTDMHILNMSWKKTAANSYSDVKVRHTHTHICTATHNQCNTVECALFFSSLLYVVHALEWIHRHTNRHTHTATYIRVLLYTRPPLTWSSVNCYSMLFHTVDIHIYVYIWTIYSNRGFVSSFLIGAKSL